MPHTVPTAWVNLISSFVILYGSLSKPTYLCSQWCMLHVCQDMYLASISICCVYMYTYVRTCVCLVNSGELSLHHKYVRVQMQQPSKKICMTASVIRVSDSIASYQWLINQSPLLWTQPSCWTALVPFTPWIIDPRLISDCDISIYTARQYFRIDECHGVMKVDFCVTLLSAFCNWVWACTRCLPCKPHNEILWVHIYILTQTPCQSTWFYSH